MDKVTFEAIHEDLTPTQRKVLKEILQGKRCGEIAQEWYKHPSAISHHLSNIVKKFGLENKKDEYYSFRWDLIYLYADYKPEMVNPELIHGRKPEIEFPGGVVQIDSQFYVERSPIEDQCKKEVLKPGSLLRIKAPKQMGKTSLMTRILAYAADNGNQDVFWDLGGLECRILNDLESFLKSLCKQVTQKLELEDCLAEYWDSENFSLNQNCSDYFEEHIFPQVDGTLVLGIDDIDKVFNYPETATDFLSLLRSWHEKAKRQSPWDKLSLILSYSTEEYAQLDRNQSPFNVGLPIQLSEFTLAQLQDLGNRHGLNWSLNGAKGKSQKHSVEALYQLVGGHPYLVRRAFYELAQNKIELNQLLQEAPTDGGIYGNHLRRHWSKFDQEPDLATAMKQVVTSPEPQLLNPGLKFKLNSMGLIQFQGNKVVPRCQLYRTYFSQVL